VLKMLHDYYPFGMEMEGPWELSVSAPENKYTYGGKVMQSDFGLDLLDFHNRFMDPAIGRFISVDKLAEHPNQIDKSVYAYAWNNPILLNDPDGNCPECPKVWWDNFSYTVKKISNGVGNALGNVANAVGNAVKNVFAEGTPDSDDFHDLESSRNGSGITTLSNTDSNANGTLPLESADEGSTVILEENEIGMMILGEAGGAMLDLVKTSKTAGEVASMGLAIDKLATIIDGVVRPQKPVTDTVEVDNQVYHRERTPTETGTSTYMKPIEQKDENVQD